MLSNNVVCQTIGLSHLIDVVYGLPGDACGGPGAVVKAAAWKVGDRGLEPHSGLQAPKKQYVSSSLTRKD